jgi:hypothetical protein
VKINEIVLLEDWVYEGLWDNIKAGVAGAKASYASGGQQRAGAAKQQEVAKVFVDRWNQAIAQNPAANTPQSLQQFMTNSTKQSGIKVPTAPTALNPAATAKYITDVVGQSLAAATIGVGAPGEEPAEQPTGPALSPGVAVTSEEPMVLNYKGQDYAVNDEGQWAKAANQKAVLSQAMQAFLDKQEKAILDYNPPQAAPAFTPTTAPATPAATAEPTPMAPASTAPVAPEPVAPASTTPTSSTLPGAPADSKTSITAPGRGKMGPVTVNFVKTDSGWQSQSGAKTLHTVGTKQYDALETQWAKQNKQPVPAPTVTSTPAAPEPTPADSTPVAAESFRRLNKIIK